MTQEERDGREPESDSDFLRRLSSIPGTQHSGRPDERTSRKTEEAEEEDFERQRQDRQHKERKRTEKLEQKKSHRKNEEADRCLTRTMRQRYASRAYWYFVIYSIICLLLLLADGSSSCKLKLPNSVMLALIGTTAVSVLGLVGIVLTGLFPKKG